MENIDIPSLLTDELAEEVGWHIGDGSMNFYKNHGVLKGIYQLRGHIEDDREHYIKRIKPIFKFLYNIDLNLREMPSTRVYGFQIWSNKLVKFKQELGLGLGKKLNIEIPNIFLGKEGLKISIIRGIFDTDGCIYLEKKNNKLYPRVEIETISYSLSEQLQQVLLGLGLRATKYHQLRNYGNFCKESYKISIRGDEMFCKFIDIIKPANPKHIKKYTLFKKTFK